MIHALSGIEYIIDSTCPYCHRAYQAGQFIVEDDHPLRHYGCGPIPAAPMGEAE